MSLPKIVTPIYELTLPSNKKKIRYRPFLVKEEKILLMALQGEDDSEILKAIKFIIQSCVLDELDIDVLPLFDLEYLFLQLRAKSVGEMVNLKYRCMAVTGVNADGEDTVCGNSVELQVNLQTIQVKFPENHSAEIKLTDSIGVKMKYPTTELLSKFGGLDISNAEQLMDVIGTCIEYIYDADTVYHPADSTKEELNDFLSSLSQMQFTKIVAFFESAPKLSHDMEFNCTKCGNTGNIRMEGLENFFG